MTDWATSCRLIPLPLFQWHFPSLLHGTLMRPKGACIGGFNNHLFVYWQWRLSLRCLKNIDQSTTRSMVTSLCAG